MDNDFFAAFNASLCEAERVMRAIWSLNGADYPAVAMENISVTDRAMPGGRYAEASAVVVVRSEIAVASGVKKGSVVVVDGERMRVMEVEREGDASRTLVCGSVGVEVPKW